MTAKETGFVLDTLKKAYPRFYSGPDAPDKAETLKFWTQMFANDDFMLVTAAVKTFIVEDNKGFAPCIGEIKNIMLRLTRQSGMDEDQAWELVRKAASNGGWGAQEEFDRLPEELQRMVGSPGQLHEWSQMDSDVFNSVVASHFRKSWRARRETRRLDALLPADVKRIISELSGTMVLDAGNKLPQLEKSRRT